MPEAEQPAVGPVTLTQVLAAVNGLRAEVIPRLDAHEAGIADLKEIVTESGLNGHTPLLKAFLIQYAATYNERQAWHTLVGAWGYRLRWLVSPAGWLKAILYAFLGGLGFTLADRLFHLSLPFDLFHLGG